MTTTVTVEATSHDVNVHRVDPIKHENVMPPEVVNKGTKVVFYAHSGQSIYVDEIREDG